MDESFVQKLSNLPARIANLQRDVLEKQKHIQELTESLKKWELDQSVTITSETDGNGKKVYANADARAAELNRRKDFDDFYNATNAEIKTLDYRVKKLHIEIELHENEQKNIRILVQLGYEN